LSSLSQALFKDIAAFSENEKIHHKMAEMARTLVKKFNVDKITGLPMSDSLTVIEDLININIKNSLARKYFTQADRKALFLPHCCRKYMDSRCKATFITETSSYSCNHCSSDCLVHKATILAQENNYGIYVLPGASCIRKIFQKHSYTGVIGVACTEELKLGMTVLEQNGIPSQGIPLTKNGCAETQFNFESLESVIKNNGKTTVKQPEN